MGHEGRKTGNAIKRTGNTKHAEACRTMIRQFKQELERLSNLTGKKLRDCNSEAFRKKYKLGVFESHQFPKHMYEFLVNLSNKNGPSKPHIRKALRYLMDVEKLLPADDRVVSEDTDFKNYSPYTITNGERAKKRRAKEDKATKNNQKFQRWWDNFKGGVQDGLL